MSTINLSGGAMGLAPSPHTHHTTLLGTRMARDGDRMSHPSLGHRAHSCSCSEGASPSLLGTAEATPMCKQAEPGDPNLKPGTGPFPSVAKRSAGGHPAHTGE